MSDEEGAQPEEEVQDWQSGPFCQHYGDPSACDEKCACGHKCNAHQHDYCIEADCPCEEWSDP